MNTNKLTAAIAALLSLPLMAAASPLASIDFNANGAWYLDTGFTATAGTHYRVQATGLVDIAATATTPGADYLVNADGVLQADASAYANSYFRPNVAPHTDVLAGQTRDYQPGMAFGALLGTWDADWAHMFVIGTDNVISTTVQGARLYLQLADGSPWDNVGTLHVTVNTPAADVPEPASFGLAALALGLVASTRRRVQRQAMAAV